MPTPPRPFLPRVFGALALFVALAGISARAQTVISWANVGTAFATGSNWTGGTGPANSLTTNLAGFGTASPTQQPVLASSRSVAGVVFGSGAGAFTLSGAGTLTLGASGVNNASTSVTQTISLPLALGAAASFTNSGTLAISGTVNTAGYGLTLTGTGASGSISGVISGAGAITKSSTGTWTLSGANTYSAGTTLSAGTLALQNASALGTGALRIAGGTLANTSGSALTVTNDLVWNGDLTFTGDGAATSDLTLTPGTTSGTGNRTVTVSSLNTLTLSSLWPDPNSGGLTKAGPGTLKLTGSNYGYGPYTINGGNLTFTSAAPFGSTVSIVTLGSFDANDPNRGTLVIDTTEDGAGTLTFFNANISGTGALIKKGTGTVLMDLSYGTNTYSGGTTVSGGTLAITYDGALGAAWGFENGEAIANLTLDGGTLRAMGTFTADRSMHVTGAGGTIEVQGGDTLTWAGIIREGDFLTSFPILTKTGAGTLYLNNSANSDYVYITVNAGTLAGDTNGLRHDITNNATVKFDQSFAGTFGSPGSVATIRGTGAVIKTGSGTVTFGADNSYSGGTTLAGGKLAVSSNGKLGSASGPVTFSGGTLSTVASFTAARATTLNAGGGIFDVASATTLTWNGVIAGAAGNPLTKTGAGTLLLGGANTYSGDTLVNTGTLKLGAANALSPNTKLIVASGAFFDANGFAPVFSDLSGAGSLDVGSGGLAVAPSGTSSFTGVLSGTGGFTMSGTGTLTLGAANTFSGATTISSGTVKLGAAGALPGGSPVSLTGGGTLDLNGNAATVGSLTGASGTTVALGSANLAVAQSSNSTFAGVISGTGGLSKSGSGTLTLTGTNTFSGATAITGGRLKLSGSAASSAFTVSGGTLSGTGTLGALTIDSGGILAPGNSPGTLNAGGTTFAGGGSLQFEINDATGSAGTNWDLLAISGSLAITATSGSPFTLDLTSLTLANTAGLAANFDSAADYAFTFITTTGGITGFSADKFAIDTTGFTNPFSGSWSVAQTGNNLTLNYAGVSAIPEPSTYAVTFGAGALALAAWRRRHA